MTKTSLVALLCLGGLSGIASAEEVAIKHNNLTLTANIDLAEGKAMSDGMVLIVHGEHAHRNIETITYIQNLFWERGRSSLAINLSYGIDRRYSMFECKWDHRHHFVDAAQEIRAWVSWLRDNGVKRITLLGHSLGATQSALYASKWDDPSVKALVLMAPMTLDNSSDSEYLNQYGKPLTPIVAQARKLIAQGKGEGKLKHVGMLGCANATATAASFLSYYGQARAVDAADLVSRTGKPILIIAAGNTSRTNSIDEKMHALVDGQRVQLRSIEGADPYFLEPYADHAMESIEKFLQGIE